MDQPESSQATRQGDGSTTLFNLGAFPVVEGSYSIYKGTSGQTETTHYTLDKDNGDLQFVAAPGNIEVKANFKYAHWRDLNWVEALNQGIGQLNARGFFRQTVRNTAIMRISAGVRVYSGPSACVDLYEVLRFSNRGVSGDYEKLPGNWSYQQDANKLVLGWNPTVAEPIAISYLRNLKTYAATSATIDVLDDWVEIVKKKAGAIFFRSLAAKVAKKGNANIDEGHFSFTNLRAMAGDLDNEVERLAQRKKPTRPAKDIQWHLQGGGIA